MNLRHLFWENHFILYKLVGVKEKIEETFYFDLRSKSKYDTMWSKHGFYWNLQWSFHQIYNFFFIFLHIFYKKSTIWIKANTSNDQRWKFGLDMNIWHWFISVNSLQPRQTIFSQDRIKCGDNQQCSKSKVQMKKTKLEQNISWI